MFFRHLYLRHHGSISCPSDNFHILSILSINIQQHSIRQRSSLTHQRELFFNICQLGGANLCCSLVSFFTFSSVVYQPTLGIRDHSWSKKEILSDLLCQLSDAKTVIVESPMTRIVIREARWVEKRLGALLSPRMRTVARMGTAKLVVKVDIWGALWWIIHIIHHITS